MSVLNVNGRGGTATLGVPILLLTGLVGATAPSVSKAQPPSGVVYVESNIGTVRGQNGIFAFRRDDGGQLTPIPGSPFSTRGTGQGPTLRLGPYDADQTLLTDPTGNYLFAVNGGSDTIAIFRTRPNGALVPIPGMPFPSGGVNPVSVGLSGSRLTVVNQNNDPNRSPDGSLPNYTNFVVTRRGQLRPIPGSTVTVEQGTAPSQALISRDGRFVFGADFLGGLLQSFVVNADGQLIQNPPQGLPASVFEGSDAPPLPLGLQIHPDLPIVYVGFVTLNRLGVYTYDDNGVLSFVGTASNSGSAICWLEANRDGTRLYTTNTADNSVSVYDTTDPLDPVEIQFVELRTPDGSPFQLALDPEEEFLHVVTQRATDEQDGAANALHVLRVEDDGTLEQVDRVVLPVPAGVRPQGVIAF